MFRGITKINGIPNSVDHGVYNLYSHFDIQTFEVNNDDATHDTHEHFSALQHTLAFCHGNEEEVHIPFASSNTPRISACKLFGL
jgi:hypothetical protein